MMPGHVGEQGLGISRFWEVPMTKNFLPLHSTVAQSRPIEEPGIKVHLCARVAKRE
jgi:hypothetical protein